MEEKKIFLQPDDEITDVIDKLKSTDKSIVVLVIPESAMVLQSVVNLKLLKRHADENDKRLAIVTDSKKGRQLASQVGISVYRKAKADEIREGESNKKIVDDIKSRFPLSDEKKSSGSASDEDKQEEESTDAKKRKSDSKSKIFRVVLGVLLAILLVSGSAWAFVSLPRAEVQLKINQKEEQKTVSVSAQADIEHQPGNFKAEFVKESATTKATFDATGRKEVGGRANGEITVYNYWSSDPQPLVESTRFIHSSTNKLFRTTESVTVPGTRIVEGETVPGTTTVNIRASEIGDSYNVSSGQFNIPGLPSAKQEKIYGRTDSGITGGYQKEILVVSQSDYNQAKAKLSEELDKTINEKIANRTGEMSLIDNPVEKILEESASPEVGNEGGSFEMVIKKQIETLAYNQEDFRLAVKEQFDSKLSDQNELLPSSLDDNIELKNVNFKAEQKEAEIKVDVDGTVISKIDEDIIKDNLVGKEKIESERYLTGFSQINDARVELWPFWVRAIPDNKDRIEIILIYGEE